MAHETARLAEYAAGLRYEDLPPAVVRRAKDCIIDTFAVIVQGSGLPRYAQRSAASGRSRILGSNGPMVQAAAAALANGASAHAFESDQAGCGRAPGCDTGAVRARHRAGTGKQRP